MQLKGKLFNSRMCGSSKSGDVGVHKAVTVEYREYLGARLERIKNLQIGWQWMLIVDVKGIIRCMSSDCRRQ